MIMVVSITPESLEERDRGNGSETRPGAKPSKRGDVAPNLLALGGPSPFRAGRRSGKFLLPEVIDGSVIEAYVRKALRVGVWRFISPESRTLMRTLTRWP